MSTAQTNSDLKLFVGVDIAAKSAAVALQLPSQRVQQPFAVSQDPAGFEQLKLRLLSSELTASSIVVLMEATSTYWVPMASYLHEAGFHLVVVNPAQAHAFAKSLLKRNKTDPIDAQTLAELATSLASTGRLEFWNPPPAVYYELQQRLSQRDSLLKLRQQLKNQLHALQASGKLVRSVGERQGKLIEMLTGEIEALEKELSTVLAQEPAWAASVKLLTSISGVGVLTASLLVVHTLNYAHSESAEQAVAYAGLAPRERRSGTSVRGGPSIGHYGDERLRRALYNASISATRHNPVLRAFHQSLLARGKKKKVARCAVMAKLARICWAVVKRGVAFDPRYGQAAAS